MLIYIFKSAACMAIFFVFYKLLLEKENMHVFKRFYLLLSIVASLLIPALVFTEYVVVNPEATIEIQSPAITDNDYIGVPAALENDIFHFEPMLWTIYFLGLTFFGLKFIRNLGQIIWRIRKNPRQRSASFIQVLLQENFPPHTFFKYIFLNKKRLESNKIPKEVLLHEETHAKQKHSYDVVFIELLQAVLWFNPLVYFFKKAIKLNHEFLADQAVLKKNIDKPTYQNTLMSYLSPDSHTNYQSRMANAINYSSIKKRFNVMKTQTSKKAILLRSLLLLPLLTMMLYGFTETKLIERTKSNIEKNIKKELEGTNQLPVNIVDTDGASKKEIIEFNVLAKRYNAIPIEKRVIPLNDLKVLELIYRKMSNEQKENAQPFPECLPKNIQKGASREQMATYNALAKKYNEMSRDDMRISMKDVEQLKYIYSIMSNKQRADAESFPDFPKPPTAPEAPEAPLQKKKNSKTGFLEVDGQTLFYVSKKGNKTYYNRWGQKVNGKGKILNPKQAHAEDIIEGQVISKVYKEGNVVVGFNTDNVSIFPPQPPLPPKPIEPLDYIVKMAKKGADFYYEGKVISSDKAIELFKKDKNLNIQTSKTDSKNPKVKISKAPIRIKKTSSGVNLETGNIKVDGKELFYIKKDGITRYFNGQGQQVDKQGRLLASNQKRKPTFYLDGEKISSAKAHQLMRNNKSIQVATEDYSEDEYAIVLTDLSKSSYNNHNKNSNPNSVIDLTEMIKKEASFFYNDEPISIERALWLTKNEHIERVQTVGAKNGKPKVYFWKKT
ncbi:hypothetical protein MTsPCn9_25770 [Croceitalea sp. MTPC9]|uniref:M56 family metallopeptidase n=1 Tax=unclassified Croceitalea TaxID=2632280 RepID=UPI002B3F59DB|nr:hypothetical protein MTsPCn6_28760 [Croceitalea sp. MTPC6]GMN17639.1 hypothetical protein MTsPCn9_25770 [Croceitalea sp. MTPC9]